MTPAEIQDALTRADRRLARLEAIRDGDRKNLAERTRLVAAAKGRLAQRDAVDTYLRELQQDANRRSVATFETLLTALVQEVLPGEKPVRLDLTTERGLPALDIGVERPDGGREDVLEDNGGAMTNVVGMALRLIAVVKAGVGRFLALDEADCWIAPDRVPAFYRVLDDGAARLGVQCLAISHHDVAGFDAGLTVSRIAGRPETGVAIEGPAAACAAEWSPEMPGFRFIRLVDVQGFADATLPLAPGVNALVGPNNHGKSTVIRALRAVFYGEVRDSLVRAGASAARVEIGVAGGRVLRYVRQPKRTPVNLWSLHEADGTLVQENGTTFETGGRDVPAWVERLFGITRVEELDVHVAHQKFPVFLLGEKPARRSAVLSIGREAGLIRDMQALQRERVTEDQRTIREGEREIARLRDSLSALDGLDALAEILRGLHDQAGPRRGRGPPARSHGPGRSPRPRLPPRDRRRRPRPRPGRPAGAGGRGRVGAPPRRGAQPGSPGPPGDRRRRRSRRRAGQGGGPGRPAAGGPDSAGDGAGRGPCRPLEPPGPRPRQAQARDATLRDLPAAPSPVLRPDAAATGRRLAGIRDRLAEAEAGRRRPATASPRRRPRWRRCWPRPAGAARPAAIRPRRLPFSPATATERRHDPRTRAARRRAGALRRSPRHRRSARLVAPPRPAQGPGLAGADSRQARALRRPRQRPRPRAPAPRRPVRAAGGAGREPEVAPDSHPQGVPAPAAGQCRQPRHPPHPPLRRRQPGDAGGERRPRRGARIGPGGALPAGRRLIGLGATPFGQAIPTDARGLFPGADHAVWLTHHDLAFGAGYPGAVPPEAIQGCALALNGHVHKRHSPVRIGDTLWVNPGNITRGSVDLIAHVPAVFVLSGDLSLAEERLPHTVDVFDLTGRQVAADASPEAIGRIESAFVSLLQAETTTDLARSDDGALIREEIEAKFFRDETPEPVRAAIRSLVEAAVAKRVVDDPGSARARDAKGYGP